MLQNVNHAKEEGKKDYTQRYEDLKRAVYFNYPQLLALGIIPYIYKCHSIQCLSQFIQMKLITLSSYVNFKLNIQCEYKNAKIKHFS